MNTKRFVVYSVWFQCIWFAAVIGNQQLQWLTVVLACCTVLVSLKVDPVKLQHIVGLAILGMLFDLANMYFGLFKFDSIGIPVWLAALWFAFVWYAYFLAQKFYYLPLWGVSLLGGAGGTLSYIAGEKLGVVEFPNGMLATSAIVFVEWMLIFLIIWRVYQYESSKNRLSL